MKKYLLLVVFLVAVASCDNEFDPSASFNFQVRQIVVNHNDYRQVKNFNYNSNGQLLSVINSQERTNSALDYSDVTSFIYSNDQLVFKTFRYESTDTLHRQDSIAYLGNGLVSEIHSAYVYDGVMRVQWINKFEYNDDGRLAKRISYSPTSTDTESSNVFYWKNGNVVKIEHFYRGSLHYESFYEYDNSINYTLNNPYFSDYEMSLSNRNNVTRSEYKDYTGLLDLACNPCNTSYEYNDFNLPKSVTYHWGRKFDITYDIPHDITN